MSTEDIDDTVTGSMGTDQDADTKGTSIATFDAAHPQLQSLLQISQGFIGFMSFLEVNFLLSYF